MDDKLIIYHGDCLDGFCAAWVARMMWKDAHFMSIRHGEDPPNVDGRDVLIVDYAWPRDVLERMRARAANLEVVDHHETNEKELQDLPYCHFSMEKSGCGLLWEYLGFEAPPPWPVQYVEDRDLWKFALPDSRAVNAWIRSWDMKFDVWDTFLATPLTRVIAEGRSIARYKNQLVLETAARSELVNFKGIMVPAVNCSARDLLSEVGELLSQQEPFSAAWYEAKGKRYWSLRSGKDGFNVGEIAVHRGGGGHRHAAGFVEETPERRRLSLAADLADGLKRAFSAAEEKDLSDADRLIRVRQIIREHLNFITLGELDGSPEPEEHIEPTIDLGDPAQAEALRRD